MTTSEVYIEETDFDVPPKVGDIIHNFCDACETACTSQEIIEIL